MMDPRAYDWEKVPFDEPMAGVRRQVITGDRVMLVKYHISDGTVFPRHNHPHEQFAFILEGTFRMETDTGSWNLGPGSVFHVPSGEFHGGQAVGDVVEVDIFSPIRDDYLVPAS